MRLHERPTTSWGCVLNPHRDTELLVFSVLNTVSVKKWLGKRPLFPHSPLCSRWRRSFPWFTVTTQRAAVVSLRLPPGAADGLWIHNFDKQQLANTDITTKNKLQGSKTAVGVDRGKCNLLIIFHLRGRPLACFFIWTPAGELPE